MTVIKTKPPVVWTIAGSDSGGGAGIQADLKTFADFDVHGCSVITALTAQNSFAVGYTVATERRNVVAQINALDSDLPAAAIKLGMLADTEIVETVARYLEDYDGFVVCDPVMAATSGGSLLDDGGRQLLRERLLPRIDLLTPNVPEAEQLTGLKIAGRASLIAAAEQLLALGARAVVITGGHFDDGSDLRCDYFSDGKRAFWLAGEAIDTPHTHGSGCTFSAAIAAAIGRGFALDDALVLAKAYVTQGIRNALQIGGGPGPVAHCGWPRALADLPKLYAKLPAQEFQFAPIEEPLGLYPVVDSAEWVERLAPLGISTIQLRIKEADDALVSAEIARAKAAIAGRAVRLFINDHWRLAIEHGCYGVHLGQEDLDSADLALIAKAGLRLGVSTHSYAEIARAHGIAPSYIAIGPIYPTTTKVMKFGEQGLVRLQSWVELLGSRYPLTAIGGISVDRAAGVLATGVGSCAVVSAITRADDYIDAVAQLQLAHQAAD